MFNLEDDRYQKINLAGFLRPQMEQHKNKIRQKQENNFGARISNVILIILREVGLIFYSISRNTS